MGSGGGEDIADLLSFIEETLDTGHSYVKLLILSVEKERGDIRVRTMIRVWARRRRVMKRLGYVI